MQTQKTKKMVVIAMLTAVSVILYFVEIPFFSGPLKLDFSDLPAAVAAVLFGPMAGILIELLKNIINLVVKDWATEMGYGSLVNFLVGVAMVAPLSLMIRTWLKRGANQLRAIVLGGAVGLVAMVAAGFAANYFIAPPFFMQVLHFRLSGAALWGYIGWATLLNIIKPVLTTVLLVPVLSAVNKNTKALRV